MSNSPTEQCLYTTRKYPCGCSAEGPGDVPDYCAEHGLPPGLRDAKYCMERGGMLNGLMEQRDFLGRALANIAEATAPGKLYECIAVHNSANQALRCLPTLASRCGNCGADLSKHPTSASAHQCSPASLTALDVSK